MIYVYITLFYQTYSFFFPKNKYLHTAIILLIIFLIDSAPYLHPKQKKTQLYLAKSLILLVEQSERFANFSAWVYYLDHIFDYFLKYGWHFNFKEFFHFFYEIKHQKITLILHGWELLIIFFVVAMLMEWNLWVTGVLIGYGQHIFFDFFYNKASFNGYSLLWRWRKGFDSEIIFPKNRKCLKK